MIRIGYDYKYEAKTNLISSHNPAYTIFLLNRVFNYNNDVLKRRETSCPYVAYISVSTSPCRIGEVGSSVGRMTKLEAESCRIGFRFPVNVQIILHATVFTLVLATNGLGGKAVGTCTYPLTSIWCRTLRNTGAIPPLLYVIAFIYLIVLALNTLILTCLEFKFIFKELCETANSFVQIMANFKSFRRKMLN